MVPAFAYLSVRTHESRSLCENARVISCRVTRTLTSNMETSCGTWTLRLCGERVYTKYRFGSGRSLSRSSISKSQRLHTVILIFIKRYYSTVCTYCLRQVFIRRGVRRVRTASTPSTYVLVRYAGVTVPHPGFPRTGGPF